MYGDNNYPYNPQGTYSYQSSPVQPETEQQIPKEPVKKERKTNGGLKKSCLPADSDFASDCLPEQEFIL
ncbi:MAG: hypothetical protein ACI4SZ_00935 [Lachnospiraceae bacterium]